MQYDRFEKKLLYRSFEQSALEQARKEHDPKIRQSWELVAVSWRHLAAMNSERCALCGRDATGAKYQKDGKRAAYCGEHLHEAIVRDIRNRTGLGSDN